MVREARTWQKIRKCYTAGPRRLLGKPVLKHSASDAGVLPPRMHTSAPPEDKQVTVGSVHASPWPRPPAPTRAAASTCRPDPPRHSSAGAPPTPPPAAPTPDPGSVTRARPGRGRRGACRWAQGVLGPAPAGQLLARQGAARSSLTGASWYPGASAQPRR